MNLTLFLLINETAGLKAITKVRRKKPLKEDIFLLLIETASQCDIHTQKMAPGPFLTVLSAESPYISL